MTVPRLLIAIFLMALMVGSAAIAQTNQRPGPNVTAESEPILVSTAQDEPDDKLDRRAFHYYINANLAEMSGDVHLASQYYQRALKYFRESREIRVSLARTQYQMQRFEEALQTLKPVGYDDVEAAKMAGHCYRAMGQEASAREAYRAAVGLDSTDTQSFTFLAAYYRKLNWTDSTVWAYRNILRNRPDSYRLWTDLGRIEYSRGNIEEAFDAFRNSIKANPGIENVDSYSAIAELHQVEGNTDSAVVYYLQGLEVDPENMHILREMVNIYVQAENFDSAITYASRVVDLNPLGRPDIRRLAILYYGVDSLRHADSLFTQLVESGEYHRANHYYLGRIALLQEDWERAREQFTRVTQMADTSAQAWIDLAFAYRQLERPEREIQTYRSGLEKMESEENALRLMFGLGAAYEQLGRYEQAVETFEELLENAPNHAPSLNYLGYMLADRNERLQYAHGLLERAIEISPNNPAYLDSYGWVLYRMGKYQEALVYLERAVELDSDPVMFDHLGDVYQALDKSEQARQAWERSLELDPDNESVREKIHP